MTRNSQQRWHAWSDGFMHPRALLTNVKLPEPIMGKTHQIREIPGFFQFAASALAPLQVLRAAVDQGFHILYGSDPACRQAENIILAGKSEADKDIKYWHSTWIRLGTNGLIEDLRAKKSTDQKALYDEQKLSNLRQALANLEYSRGDRIAINFSIFLAVHFLRCTATYAAVYGLQLLCSTYIKGIASPIVHGITASLAGIWLTTGAGLSGITSGLLIGATAFAVQQYALPAIMEALAVRILSELKLNLIGGAITIVANIPLVMLLSLFITALIPQERDVMPYFRYEFPILGLLLPEPQIEQGK